MPVKHYGSEEYRSDYGYESYFTIQDVNIYYPKRDIYDKFGNLDIINFYAYDSGTYCNYYLTVPVGSIVEQDSEEKILFRIKFFNNDFYNYYQGEEYILLEYYNYDSSGDPRWMMGNMGFENFFKSYVGKNIDIGLLIVKT